MTKREVPETAQMVDRHRGRLEAFVLRARRVAAHSLAADRTVLIALAGAPHSITLLGNGEARIRQELPAEELVESAAARVRPLLLEGEDCSYSKALAALGYFCRSMPDEAARIRTARTMWQHRTGDLTVSDSGYRVMIADVPTGATAELDAQQLALAWIYGDVVHHDRERCQRSRNSPGSS